MRSGGNEHEFSVTWRQHKKTAQPTVSAPSPLINMEQKEKRNIKALKSKRDLSKIYSLLITVAKTIPFVTELKEIIKSQGKRKSRSAEYFTPKENNYPVC